MNDDTAAEGGNEDSNGIGDEADAVRLQSDWQLRNVPVHDSPKSSDLE